MKNLILIVLCIPLLALECDGPYEEIVTGQIVEPYRFNLVGILGEDADTAYIEVTYAEVAGQNSNSLVHRWVKPPVIIGGHYANVTYNEITSNGALKYIRQEVVDYAEGGSHYMQIVNHGDKPIEYFVAGAHPVEITDLNKEFAGLFRGSPKPPTMMLYDIYPRVIYNDASVYFLLNPAEKPATNQYILDGSTVLEGSIFSTRQKEYYNYERSKIIFFEGDKIGNLVVKKPWTVAQVMALYRTEYRNRDGTLLWEYSFSDQKKFILSKSKKIYYGFIPPGGALRSSAKNPFITADYCRVCRERADAY